MDGTDFGDLAGVYREMRKVGFGPRETDLLEIWEIAVMLGADRIDAEEDGYVVNPVDPSAAPVQDRFAHLHQRLAHAQGLATKPEPAPMSADQAAMIANMGLGSFV